MGGSAAVEDEVVTSLRLSGVITGSENLIGLERTQDGTSFWVREGQTVQGVTLQSIDRMRKLAYIRIGEANAVVQLASKQVLICRPGGDAKRLREFIGEEGRAESEFEAQITQLVSAYPNGLAGYLDYLRLEYDKGLNQAVQDADQLKVPTEKPSLVAKDDIFLPDMVPIFGQFGRIINSGNLNEFLMDAALVVRRQELAGLPLEPPLDPWAADGARLKLERGTDGRLNLSSVYEKKAGAT